MSEATDGQTAAGELLRLLGSSPDLDEFLDRVVRLSCRAVPAAVACGVTMRRERQAITIASSDPFAGRLDDIQSETGQGPCVQSLVTAQPIAVEDLESDERWPLFRKPALDDGLRSSRSLPLAVGGEVVAALNLYSDRPHAFSAPDTDMAKALAEHCSSALEVLVRHIDQQAVGDQLLETLRSRAVIDQALGIVMAQQRCTASAALEILRRGSQQRNRKLRDLAADIVTSVSGQPPEPANFELPT
jgi:putative methionine-R-sulfoxide reductase with GAF domain